MNKHSKVLALKYRPQTFEDLIGQNIVAETIANSIKDNKVPNAYLFTGIRGVGKTTLARIVAKALNCKNGFNNLCKINLCENCEAIINSSHIDIFELDAASKSSVENTKELIEEEVKNSKAKSLSLTASREFAVGLSNSRALAVWSRSIGKEVPANAHTDAIANANAGTDINANANAHV